MPSNTTNNMPPAYQPTHTSEDTLPTYADLATEASPPDYSPEPPRMPPTERLRRFLIFRLATDYGLEQSLALKDRPHVDDYEHLTNLAAEYTKLLSKRRRDSTHRSRRTVELLKLLEKDVFQPGRQLGIPADVVEFFLFCFRVTKQCFGERLPFGTEFFKAAPSLLLVRLAVDWQVLFTRVVSDAELLRPATSDNMLDAFKTRCLAVHKRYYVCLLEPRHARLRFVDWKPQSVDDAAPWRIPGDWPNVSALFCEAYRPSEELMHRDGILARGCIVNPAAVPRWWDQGLHPGYIKRPSQLGQKNNASTVVWLPGEDAQRGWWLNPDARLAKPQGHTVFLEAWPGKQNAWASAKATVRKAVCGVLSLEHGHSQVGFTPIVYPLDLFRRQAGIDDLDFQKDLDAM